MTTREKILEYIAKNQQISGAELSKHFQISRQALNKHIQQLIKDKKIYKTGKTKGVSYHLYDSISESVKSYKKKYSIKKLDEDNVFQKVSAILNLKNELMANVYEIVQYVFTEMVNNVIDHSKAAEVSVQVKIDKVNCEIEISDKGIGLFHSIQKKFELEDEHEAMLELMKGKKTTWAERHSGEGIFFSSRSVDYAKYSSHNISLIFDNTIPDVLVQDHRRVNGTDVKMLIRKDSENNLAKIFKKHAPEDYDFKFEKSQVFIKLYNKNYISRSEAKRMLSDLDKFREIILDFKGVTTVGQGFADEVFRVFLMNHPGIKINIENAAVSIDRMIQHVVDNN